MNYAPVDNQCSDVNIEFCVWCKLRKADWPEKREGVWQPGQLDQPKTKQPSNAQWPSFSSSSSSSLKARARRFTVRHHYHRNSVCLSQWAILGPLAFSWNSDIQFNAQRRLEKQLSLWGNLLKDILGAFPCKWKGRQKKPLPWAGCLAWLAGCIIWCISTAKSSNNLIHSLFYLRWWK